MESNLPATRDDSDSTRDDSDSTRDGSDSHAVQPAVAPSRPLSVALMPLALATFILLALIIAAWTFLAATT